MVYRAYTSLDVHKYSRNHLCTCILVNSIHRSWVLMTDWISMANVGRCISGCYNSVQSIQKAHRQVRLSFLVRSDVLT